jgi:hypothetical protein
VADLQDYDLGVLQQPIFDFVLHLSGWDIPPREIGLLEAEYFYFHEIN